LITQVVQPILIGNQYFIVGALPHRLSLLVQTEINSLGGGGLKPGNKG
jgi:hypothetical protein